MHIEESNGGIVNSTTRAKKDEYFEWLCSRIKIPEGKSYWTLFEILHMREFIWVIGNDDNRIQDGRDLKLQYVNEKDGRRRKIHKAGRAYDEAVSVLEVLIALSERVGFLIDIDPPVCAWMLIKNLKLDQYDDRALDNNYRGFNKIELINDILDKLIWRTYKNDGSGGFFPLRHPKKNQTGVEIWYQMTEWIEENYNPHDI